MNACAKTTIPLLCGILLANCHEVAGLSEHELSHDGGESLDAGGGGAANDWHVPTEQCNFRDDDYDGMTDEGFDWELGPWVTALAASDLARLEAVRLGDGRVAFAVSQEGGDSVSSIHAGTVDATASSPTTLEDVVTVEGIADWHIAFDAIHARVGLGYVRRPTGEADCASGCVAEMMELGTAPELTTSEAQALGPFKEHNVTRLLALAWTTAGYATFTVDEDGYGWVEWIDHLAYHFPNSWEGRLEGFRPDVATMAVGPAVAWAAEGLADTGVRKAFTGVVSLGGYRQHVEAQPLVAGTEDFAVGAGTAHVWIGARAAAALTVNEAVELRCSADPSDTLPIAAPSDQESAHSAVPVHTELLLVSTTRHSEARLRRVNVAEGSTAPFATFDATRAHALVTGGFSPIVLRVTDDGTEVQAAVVRCVE